MSIVKPRSWTAAEDARLKILWAEGHSGARIGEMMGRKKASVIGHAHRMGLTPRGTPTKRRSVVVHVSAGADVPRAQPLPPGARTLPPLPSELMSI